MSIDYCLWKWLRDPPGITPGLCYLLLAEGIECEEVAFLDVEKLRAEIAAAFPELTDEGSNFPLNCEIEPTVIHLSLYSSAPDSIANWFLDLAEREGMTFFDPIGDPITKADEREFRRRQRALERQETALAVQKELGELSARAEQGDPKALFRLGSRYSFGDGVRKNAKKAFELFRRAAEAGHGDGMFNLAGCYRLGEGVPRDVDKAIAWYERAAETDKLFGPFALGEIYADGETGAVDVEKAVGYLKIAWESGNLPAAKRLRELGAYPPDENRS